MVKLIAEGGVAGHLAHLYDNRDLTFEKLADILTAASRGKLVGTEKTDGFNIYLGFKGGEAKAARNKGDMRKGGMNAVDLAMREFAGGPEIKKVYVDAFSAFEAAVASLSDEEKLAIFGPEGEIFYNSEIMGPGASNVVNYDSNIITIHGSGHKRYDEETDKVVNADVDEASKVLDQVVDRFEQAIQGKNFNVQRTAFVNLQKLEGSYDLKIALEKIKKAGLQGDMTVQDFLAEKLLEDVNEKFPSLNDDMKQQIVNRITKAEGAPTLTQIYRGLGGDKNLKEQVRSYVQTGNKTISKLIWPIEDAIHDFAVAMLEGMESAYILDNPKELARLKKEVQTAIKSIQAYQGEGQEMAHEILSKQLQKIKHLDNITSVAEGFVFEYDGQLYKFTGNFAPINQILGLFRFGRKGVKIPRVDEAKGATETVAIIPGAFKPPHRGHLDMVRHYADNADRVIVMVSPKPRQTPNGRDISQEDSIAMWNLYLDKVGLKNVQVIESPHPSPVRSAYEYVEKTAEPGEMVMLGTSTKGGDQSRFNKNIQQYAKEGVRVLDSMKYAFDPVGEELSATDFRSALESGELATAKFLPNGVSPEDVLGILGIQGETEEVVEHIALPIFFRMIEEVMSESMRTTSAVQSGYKSTWRDTLRMINRGANKDAGGGKGHTKGDPKLTSAPPGGGSLEESTYGADEYEYGFQFDRINKDGSLTNIDKENETEKFYGASIQKPVLALIHLIAGAKLSDSFLEELILYTRRSGRSNENNKKLSSATRGKVMDKAREVISALDLGDSTFYRMGKVKGGQGNQQSAQDYNKFMAALLNYESHPYLQNYPAESQRILNLMRMASTDRQSKKETGGYEGFKIYKNRIMNPANDILKGSGIQIKRMFGKGGGTPPKGPKLAKNVSLVIELNDGQRYLFSFYSTKPGETKDIRKKMEAYISEKLARLLLKTSVPSGDKEIEEISSMAGGSVEGYAMPLGAKKKKKKKVYMEPHMHQDE